AVELSPDDAEVYSSRGTAWLEYGQPDHALPDFERALILEPNNLWHYCRRGYCWLQEESYEKAQADFSKAVLLERPMDGYAYLGRGTARQELKRFTLALTDFSMAARRMPESPWPYLGRAAVLIQMGYPDSANQELDRARPLVGSDPRRQAGLAWILAT